jgi:PadR family transcriptional regulator
LAQDLELPMPTGELRPDDAELVVLSVLAEEPLYGYAITKAVAARSGGEIRLSPGVLYPLLAKLESQKLIASEWEEVKSERADEASGGRRRKWYKLSAKGRKRLDQKVESHRAYLSRIEAFIRGGGAADVRDGGGAE